MLARSIENTADLRQEIFHLERDFTQERLKCRALEEELQNPLNVHRWRKLEGSDPTTYELVLKTQILQKRLLTANAEALKRESQLKEVERLNINLKEILGRQPGPEAFEKMKRCQRVLKQRGVKIKVSQHVFFFFFNLKPALRTFLPFLINFLCLSVSHSRTDNV